MVKLITQSSDSYHQTFRESGDFTEKTKNVPSTVKLSLILVKLFIDAS